MFMFQLFKELNLKNITNLVPCFALTLIYHPNARPNYLLAFLHRI